MFIIFRLIYIVVETCFKFFGIPKEGIPKKKTKGQGSGFIIHPSGLAVTNHHVIEGADVVKVKIGDKVSEGSILATIENGAVSSLPKNKVKVKEIEKPSIEQKSIESSNLNVVKQVKKVFAEPASKDDIDPIETDEWIESLNSVIEND